MGAGTAGILAAQLVSNPNFQQAFLQKRVSQSQVSFFRYVSMQNEFYGFSGPARERSGHSRFAWEVASE